MERSLLLSLQGQLDPEQTLAAIPAWPSEYRNSETGRVYAPHHDAERTFVFDDGPRYSLAKGGEGGGKSVAGIIKGLGRIARGLPGIMVSPDFEHFKKSLWPEFRRWCPWDCVIPSQRRRASKSWTPPGPFDLVFTTPFGEVTLLCGGIEDPTGWEGPNVNWAHIDEARRCKDAQALKTLDGRIRIPGPNGEPPQLWLTTTPRKNWLFEYFGPLLRNEQCEADDPREGFKASARVVNLLTIDNERAGNLQEGYTQARAQTLSSAEQRVLLGAEWEDIDDVDRFLSSIIQWDTCKEDLPPLGQDEPCVVALDAGTKNDSFGLAVVTRHPTRHQDVAVRYVREWKPVNGVINFQGTDDDPGPEKLLRKMCKRENGERPRYNVVCVAFDPHQLHDMSQRLGEAGEALAWFREFNQGTDRLEADKQLYDLIINHRLAHDGDPRLRAHIDNANRKPDPETRKLRLVKREPSLKIDLAVCASMGSHVCLTLDI